MALTRPTSYWRKVNPRGAIADLVTVFREAGPNRWRFAALAAAATYCVFTLMFREDFRALPPPPKVTFITTWKAGRSDAEIIASNIANQKLKERLAAEQAKRDEEVRNVYKSLGRMSGMDVEAIERQAAQDRAAEARARSAGAQQPKVPPAGE